MELKGKGKCPLSSASSSALSYFSSSSSSSYSKDICARALQEIIHVPKICAYRYMKSLADDFRLKGPALFTEQRKFVILNFENTYTNVNVTVYEGFFGGTKYLADGKTEPVQAPLYSNTAKDYLNIDGFVRDSTNLFFFYTFNIWSRYAQLLQITLSMSIDYDPIFC